jgi:hypothetical protein
MSVLVAVLALPVHAQTTAKLLQDNVSSKPESINLKDVTNFKSEAVTGYTGRNNNRVEKNLSSQVKTGNGVTRSVSLSSKTSNSQLENLESTAGELIQKLEDDRLKKAKMHKTKFDNNKGMLQDTYDVTKRVVAENLGSEQDPVIQNAFKCSNLRACNEDHKKAKSGTDVHDLPQCDAKNRLRWNGSRWECVKLFAKPSSKKCGSHQYAKAVNGGTACINYLYYWELGEFSKCQRDNTKVAVPGCYRKKTQKSTNKVKVDDSICKEVLGTKGIPKKKVESCTYATSSWIVGSWSACDPNGRSSRGSKYRDVYCPNGKECDAKSKPATTDSCIAKSQWVVSDWGTCVGGSQTRSVTCPTGYSCGGEKPTSTQSCTLSGDWYVGSWGACNNGLQTRTVACPRGYVCDEPKPADNQMCKDYGVWQTGPWGACRYITDGQIPGNLNGERERTVTCEAGKLCDPTKKPLNYEYCSLDLNAPHVDDAPSKGPDPDSGDIDYIEDHYDNLGGPLTKDLGGFDRNHGNSLNLGI